MSGIKDSSFNGRVWRGFTRLFALCTLFGLSLGHAAVTVDQTPLTVKSSLPPNVTLMLDDSGSMQWTVMPDDPAGNDGQDTELINSAINGIYYDPEVRYLPPYTATAQPNAATPTTTRLPNAAFDAAWYDGFDRGTGSTINIAAYKPPTPTSPAPPNVHPDGPIAISNKAPRFSHTFQFATSPVYQYANAAGCPSGMVLNANGLCALPNPINEPPYCQGHGGYDSSRDRCGSVDFRPTPCGSTVAPGATGSANSAGLSLNDDQCTAPGMTREAPRCQGYGNSNYSDRNDRCNREDYRPLACGNFSGPGAAGTVNSSGLTLVSDRCRSSEIDPSCPTGYDFSLNAGPSGEDCRQLVSQGGTMYRSLFVYVDPDDSQRYYIGASGTASTLSGTSTSPIAGTCAEVTSRSVTNLQTNQTLSTGVPVANCQNADADSGHRDGSGNVITVGRNVANWFSYYRKRILMAKSGLMNSLATLEPTLRFGFGSINGGYYDPSGAARNDNADRLPSDKTAAAIDTKPAIARVKPFGNGGSGTQRQAFWDWLAAAETEGRTPLRRALSAVGAYYDDDDQAWQSGTAENPTAPTTELACRQAYTILMTDGFWNGTNPGFGNEDGPADRAIVRRDGPNQQCFEYPLKSSSSSVCDAPLSTKPYVDARSDTLADVAMYYWLKDLRSAVNAVPASSADPAFWQHMTTFTVGLFAQDDSLPNVTPSGTTGDDIALWAQTGQAPNNFAWPDPASDSSNNIADLVHAGINGRGGFFSAGNPEQFESGMRRAIQRVTERVGTGASLAANSTRLDTGTTTYQSVYFSGRWRGDVKAFAVDPNTGAIASTQTWSASERMPEWDDRTIKTYNPSGGTTAAKFPALANLATLSPAQQTALGADTTEQQNVINYLRGSASQERRNNGTYRDRDGLLGDIISSQPVFVGAPDPNLHRGRTFPGASLYADHVATNTSRAPRLWVAGNDGMLHAFNAAASGTDPLPGAETFAYLPDAVIRNGVSAGVGIKILTDPNYGSSSVPHQYFNDGELTVSDVYLNSAWKTVLVGSTGRGNARAIYALDITDPAAPSLLWERSAGDGLAGHTWIGQNTGKPVIALVGDPASPTWAVLVGNGYNSSENKAALLQFNGEYHGTGSKPSNYIRTQLYMMSWFKKYSRPAGGKITTTAGRD